MHMSKYLILKKIIIFLLLLPSILWASEGKVSITWLAANGDFAPQIIVVKALNQILETEANSQPPTHQKKFASVLGSTYHKRGWNGMID